LIEGRPEHGHPARDEHREDEAVTTVEQTAEYPITDEQVQFYQENGYVQLFDVLTPAELQAARTAIDEALQMQMDRRHDLNGDPKHDRIFLQLVNLWEVHPGMRRYVLSHKLAEIARRLSRARRVRLWHDHALVKMPGDSKPSAWHQDLPYWPMEEAGALSCWMALDDVDEANGCMAFVPGSHSFGKLEPIRLTDPQDLFSLVSAEVRKGRELRGVFQPMPAGSCTFHEGRTFHYAGPNTKDRPRRAMITIYMPDDIHYNGARHVCTDDLNLAAGAVLQGERFPILAGEAANAG
jgi:ectoine hydroxylase-related dioxygenase (phytanoyl-CoA dioxygenase family)